jgi:hypothetical protein
MTGLGVGREMSLHVTRHAAERYCERVNPRLTIAEAIAALSTPAVRRAALFGAPYVRLGTGQRIVLEGSSVVTVLPKDSPHWRLGAPKESRNG